MEGGGKEREGRREREGRKKGSRGKEGKREEGREGGKERKMSFR